MEHPAGKKLLEFAMEGCPTKAGRDWSVAEITAAVERGPHESAMGKEQMQQYQREVKVKGKQGKLKIMAWDDIKKNPPKKLKVSPFAMIPHKSRKWRGILDLSFALRMEVGRILASVNQIITKTAPQWAINQMGHALLRTVHAFAEANDWEMIFLACGI